MTIRRSILSVVLRNRVSILVILPVGRGQGVGEGVLVGDGIGVGVKVLVGKGVFVGEGVMVGVGGVTPGGTVFVGRGVAVADGVSVSVAVEVNVNVAVKVAVAVEVGCGTINEQPLTNTKIERAEIRRGMGVLVDLIIPVVGYFIVAEKLDGALAHFGRHFVPGVWKENQMRIQAQG